MGTGCRSPVLWRRGSAARTGKRKTSGIGAVALAAPCAGRAWPWDRGRRELGRSGDRIAERPAGSGQPDLSGAWPAGVQLSAGRLVGHRRRRRRGHDRRRLGERIGSDSARLGSYSGTGSGVAGAIVATGYADMLGQSVGTGQCVALAQATSDVGYTSTWSPGAQVEGDTDIAVGTVIATFGSDGTYTNTYGQSHTAIYLGQDSSKAFMSRISGWGSQPKPDISTGRRRIPMNPGANSDCHQI